MKKLFLTGVLFVFATLNSYAQDVQVNIMPSPVSGCALTAAETITIEIENVGLTDLSAVPFSLVYTVNAGFPVVESVVFPSFLPNTTILYSFVTTANLLIPGVFLMEAACVLPSDINTSNDVINGYLVTNSAPSVGGVITGSNTVCSSTNTGMLTLAGETGNINRWESSIDGGVSWVNLSNTTNAQNYLNLTATTIYRAAVQSGGCTEIFSATATVTVDLAPVGGNITPLIEVCETYNTGTLTLSDETGSILDWQFSTDGGITWTPTGNLASTFVFTDLTLTTWYRAIIGNGICPSATSGIGIVTVHPKPVAFYTVADACLGSISNFVDASTISAGNISYRAWDFDDGGSSVAMNPIHTYGMAITYTASLILRSDQGCSDTTYINAIVTPLPSPEITETGLSSLCSGGSINLSGEPTLIYNWSTAEISQTIAVSSSGWYTLVVTDPMTACTDLDSIEVIFSALPVANAGNDTTISLGSIAELYGSGGDFYSWSPGSTLDNSFIAEPIAYPLVTTVYELLVSDSNGCTAIDSVIVTVLSDYLFTTTNVVTPNGDGANDVWNIMNIENYPDNHVAIYNRYGQEMFSSDGYNNEWDATYQGEFVPDGTYYYVLNFDGSPKSFKGAITILGK
jgi:gliding motility-associated-like protein